MSFTTKLITIVYMLAAFVTLSSCDKDQSALPYTGKTARIAAPAPECIDADKDTYGENCSSGPDCADNDSFYNEICPTCKVTIIPSILGWLIGEKEDTKTLFVSGERDAEFDNATVIKWESAAIEVVSRHVFFKRFMFIRAKFNGANLDKGEYRVLVGKCVGKIKWAFNRTQHCITSNCMDNIKACNADTECTAWMACMNECGDDMMLCPTICGAFYQSPNINAFIQCGLDNGCIKIDFSYLPPCKLPETKPVTVGNIDGFWWVSAIQGEDYVLYDDCQRFIFNELSATQISVENSTLVTYKGETRAVKNIGKYTRTTDGYLKLVYENWAGYYEQYYPLHVSPNVMIMHVCSVDSSNNAHDYATLILSRVPLDSLGSTEMTELQTALQNIFSTTLEDFTLIRTADCPNQ